MGRHQTKKSGDEQAEGAEMPVAPMVGGTDGVTPDLAGAIKEISFPGETKATALRPLEDLPVEVPKSYRVMNGGSITVAGMRYRMPAGKVVDDRQFDLVQLRHQGIVLEEIVS